MRIRVLIFATAAVLAFGAGAAVASRPVAALPSASLPNGTVVDLNTGIATTPDGHHYTVSPAELATLREQVLGGPSGSVGASPPPATVTVPAPATGRAPR